MTKPKTPIVPPVAQHETLNDAVAAAAAERPDYTATEPVLTEGAGTDPLAAAIAIPAHHRVITEHHTDLCNSGLTITVCDPPGAGGANHLYLIEGMDASENPSVDHVPVHGPAAGAIVFQNGPITESGANGLTHEVLLAIIIDRLRSFQAGRYACAENARALAHCQAALGALGQRSAGRAARGVEGTSAV